MTTKIVKEALIVAQALLDTIEDMGEEGAPSGVLYSAVMQYTSLENYEKIMATLVKAGRLRQEGFVYYYIKREEG